jgi:hypothetical protein
VDTAAFIISGLAAVIAAIGTILANRRANEALRESRKAVTTALWAALQDSVQRFVGFDPANEAIGDRLVNLRINMIELADEYAAWRGFDRWLEAERLLGATLGRQVMETSETDDDVEQRVANLAPLSSWAEALSQNLRRFRATGYDSRMLAELQTHADDLAKRIHTRNGWELPPTTNPLIEPIS